MHLSRVCSLAVSQNKPPNGLFFASQTVPSSVIGFDVNNMPSQDTVAKFAYLGISSSNFSTGAGTTYTKSRSVTISSGPVYTQGECSCLCSTTGNSPINNTGSNGERTILIGDIALQGDVYWATDGISTSTTQYYKTQGVDPYPSGGLVNSTYRSVSVYSGGTSYGEWIQYLFPKAVKILSIRQYTRTGASIRGMANVRILASSDKGATWSNYGSLNFPNAEDSGAVALTGSPGTYNRCYRIVAESSNGGTTLHIRRLEFSLDWATNS